MPDTKRSFGRRRAQRPVLSNVSVRTIHHGVVAADNSRLMARCFLTRRGKPQGFHVLGKASIPSRRRTSQNL